MFKVTDNHINEIKGIILSNLQRIVPQIMDIDIRMEKTCHGEAYYKVTSTKFQTTPALFKSVQIIGTAQPFENTETKRVEMIFKFSYYWETYCGGTNGTDLGYLIFEIYNEDEVRLKQPFTYSKLTSFN